MSQPYFCIDSYKESHFYWEVIVCARKVSVVALSVFGKELGVERQSQVVLLLILICIVLEITRRPFREASEDHSILKHLELSSLLVEWGTFWCGLMIHQSGPKSESTNIFMTACVFAINIALMSWFLIVLTRAVVKENHESLLSLKQVTSYCIRSSGARKTEPSISSNQARMNDQKEFGIALVENPLNNMHSQALVGSAIQAQSHR